MPEITTELLRHYPDLASCEPAIGKAANMMEAALRAEGHIYVAGNGGSAADAGHFAAELLKGFCSQRRLNGEFRQAYGEELAQALQGGLRVIPLTEFTALHTAWANDCDAEHVFAQLVHTLGRAEDVLFCLSTSGNSKNLLHAARVARARKMSTIALTGPTGGRLKEYADVTITAPGSTVYTIQERHLPIYHALARMLEEAFFDGN